MNSSSEITGRNGGQQANHTGNALETFVENALKSHGYTEFINHKELRKNNTIDIFVLYPQRYGNPGIAIGLPIFSLRRSDGFSTRVQNLPSSYFLAVRP